MNFKFIIEEGTELPENLEVIGTAVLGKEVKLGNGITYVLEIIQK